MPIEFRCTSCGKLLRTADETAGREAQCPACGTVMSVPETVEAAAPEAASPFGGENPFESSSADRHGDEVNPYEAPADYASWQSQSLTPPIERVRIPAICLMVGSGLGIVLQIASVGFYIVVLIAAMNEAEAQEPAEMYVMTAAQVGSGVLGILLRAVVFFGAIKMKNLQNYGLSMAAAIIAVIPCFSACCLLELPFGIWALVVLSNAEVKQAFR